MRSIQILVLLCALERAIPTIASSLLLASAFQKELGTYLYESLLSVPNIQIYGPAPSLTVHRAPLCSFNIENIHPTDIVEILDLQVRSSRLGEAGAPAGGAPAGHAWGATGGGCEERERERIVRGR
jgi:selenocysteine lyase/cysteine desulfurase